MTTHSEIGASSAYRWTVCQGSVQLCRDIPQTTSEYAEEGTRVHEICEQILNIGLKNDFVLKNNKEVKEIFEPLTDEVKECVKLYVNTIVSDLSKFKNPSCFVEQKLVNLKIHENMYGTADFVIVDEKDNKAAIYDYKHGAGVFVKADNNKQLQYYASCLNSMYGITNIECVIVQPRTEDYQDTEDLGKVRRVLYDEKQIKEINKYFYRCIQQVYSLRAVRNSYEVLHIGDHCQFCPALATCPAQYKNAIELAKNDFKDGEAFQLPEVKGMSLSEIKKVLMYGDQLTNFVKAVNKHALDLMLGGVPIDGYKVVEGRKGFRKWVDEKQVQIFLNHNGVDPFEKKLKTPAQVEKEIKDKKVKKQINDFCTQNEGKATLVKDTDKRPAIPMITAKDDFDVIN